VVANYWRLVEHHRCTTLSAVPTVLAALADVPVNADISSLRYCRTGAAVLPPELAERFKRLTGLHVHEALGMTEMAGISSVTPPGRRMVGTAPDRSSTVLSTPTVVEPPSMTRSMRPSRSCSTWAACVGLGREKRFALGAAIGMPAAASSARATGCAGTLTATVSSPAVTSSGTERDRGSTSVSGPGQNRKASVRAISGMSATSGAMRSTEVT